MIFSCIRHGQTQMNVEDLVCGRTDIPLTEVGLKQAEEAAVKIKDKILEGQIPPIDCIISSPLIRAKQTAETIGKELNLSISTDKRIIEQNYGKMEGFSRLDPEYLAIRKEFAVKYPEGESMLDVAKRVYEFFDEVKESHKDKNHILIVAHGGTIRLINTYFHNMTNKEFADFRALNCEIQTFSNL